MVKRCECGRSMAGGCPTAEGQKCLICAVERISTGWHASVALYQPMPVVAPPKKRERRVLR